MNTEVVLYNALLRQEYGEMPGSALPRFRVVWSTEQYEHRWGIYNIFSESGDIFLREERGVFYVPKYDNYEWKDCWVLERLASTAGNPYLEGITKLSFEPLWVFGVGGSEKKPNWKAIQLLVRNSLFGDPNARAKSPSDLEEEERKKLELEKQKIKAMLSEDTEGLAYNLKSGSAVSVNGFRELRDKVEKGINK